MDFRVWILGLSMTLSSAFVYAEANNGFYAGTGAGLYYTEIDDIDYDESAGQLRVFGGYQLNEYLAFEAGYSKLFESSASENIPLVGSADVDLDGTAWDVSVRPMMQLNDRFHAFGILGYANYDLEYDVEVTVTGLPSVSVSEEESESELFYGVGAGFNVADNWTVRGEWIKVDVDSGDFGMFSVAATYSFN